MSGVISSETKIEPCGKNTRPLSNKSRQKSQRQRQPPRARPLHRDQCSTKVGRGKQIASPLCDATPLHPFASPLRDPSPANTNVQDRPSCCDVCFPAAGIHQRVTTVSSAHPAFGPVAALAAPPLLPSSSVSQSGLMAAIGLGTGTLARTPRRLTIRKLGILLPPTTTSKPTGPPAHHRSSTTPRSTLS